MTSCFVCDKDVTDGIYLTVAETFFTKTDFPTKISQLIGNDFMVVVADEDQMCKRCASLLNKSDKLEVDLLEIHNMIKQFLDFKYNLISVENQWSESEMEHFKVENESKDFELGDLPSGRTGLSFIDEDNTQLSQSNNSDHSNDLIKHTFTRNIKSEKGCSHDAENNVKLYVRLNNESSQNSVSEKESGDTAKEEKMLLGTSVEDAITSPRPAKDDHSSALGDSDCKKEISVNEENHSYLSDDKLEFQKGKESMIRNVKNVISVKTEKDMDEPSKKCRPILPKIVKSNDILRLASLCVFEQVDTSRIIKINTGKYENNEPVEQFIQVANESSENLDSYDAGTTKTISSTIIKQKRDYSSQVFKCDICGKECSTKNRLEMHKTIHEKKICDYCGREFNSNYRLKVHRNIHTKQRKFTCNICGENFIHHSTYWYHRKWHDEPFPYSCEFCGRPFKHSSMLAIHRRSHTGERPYKCSYCPLAFTISTTMKKHEMLHTKEFAFTCSVCLKGFTTRSKYVYHMAKMHKILDNGGDVPKRKRKRKDVTIKKQKSQPKSNIICESVDEHTDQYLPLELGEGDEIVIGTEKMRRYNDISVEVINKDSSQPDGDGWEEQYCVNSDPNLPVELGEGIVEIVLGPDDIVLSEDMIISDNLISQVDS